MICPGCKGEKRVFVFADGHHEDGTPFHNNGYRDCFTCDGSGEITDEHIARIAAGRKLRDERVSKRVSLMDAAHERGISPEDRSAIEMGRERKSN